MAQIYPLDRVIQRVEAGTSPPGDATQRLVTVDVRKREVAPGWRLFGRGDLRHYLVSNRKDPHHEASVEIEQLRLPDLNHPVDVRVTVQVSCPEENEEKLAVALCDPAVPPSEMLQRTVHAWLLDSADDDVQAFVLRCVRERDAVSRDLAAALIQKTGLRARVSLVLDAEAALKTERVDTHVAVAVNGYDEEQDLGIRLDLEVDDQRRDRAVLHHPRRHELDALVTGEVKRFIRQNVSLQEYSGGLAAGPVRDALVRHLNAVLAPVGRKAGALVLQTKAVPLNVSLSRELNVPCKVREYPQQIEITNKVLLLLKDLALYRSKGSPELDGWLRRTLEAVIPRVLFEARYIDLLIRFEPWAERIKEALGGEAAAIGYEIRHFITVPDLDPIRLREPFLLEPVGTFETRLRNVEAKVQVVVNVRIPDLERIEPLLNRREDVRALMEEAALAALRERLHAIDPERFYMRFGFPDPRYPEERQSVEAELTGLVRDRLQGPPFHAEVLSIVVKQVDTDLAERFKRLQNNIRAFSLEAKSYHGGAVVTIEGDFRVMSVDPDGWHLFQQLEFDIDQIGEQLTRHLRSCLRTMRPQGLTFKEEKDRATLATLIARLARAFVAEQFGLVIDVLNVQRELTRVEVDTAAHETQLALARLQIEEERLKSIIEAERGEREDLVAELGELRQRRAIADRMEDNEEEVAELDAKIDRVKKKLGTPDIPTVDQVRLEHLGPKANAITPGAESNPVAAVNP